MAGGKMGGIEVKAKGTVFILTANCKERIRQLGWGDVFRPEDLKPEQWARLRAEGYEV